MDVIIIESEAFKLIMNEIQAIRQKLDEKLVCHPEWLDVPDTCRLLKISKRTLQNYRDRNILPFSQIGGKIYFKKTDIDAHLEAHYNGK